MKFLVPNYSCLQDPWLRGYCPQIPVLSVLCPQLNLLNPLRKQFLGTPLIWGLHHMTTEVPDPLGCCAMWLSQFFLMFWRNIHLHLGLITLKMKTKRSFKMLGRNYPTTKCTNPKHVCHHYKPSALCHVQWVVQQWSSNTWNTESNIFALVLFLSLTCYISN